MLLSFEIGVYLNAITAMGHNRRKAVSQRLPALGMAVRQRKAAKLSAWPEDERKRLRIETRCEDFFK